MTAPDAYNPRDWLWGARDIGAAVGISERSARHFIKVGRIPAIRLGKKLGIRKPVLLAAIEQGEREAQR